MKVEAYKLVTGDRIRHGAYDYEVEHVQSFLTFARGARLTLTLTLRCLSDNSRTRLNLPTNRKITKLTK